MLEEPAMVDKQKYPVSNKDGHLVCQEEVDGPLQMILEEATATAGKRLKQSEVLRNLRVCTPMRMTTRKTGTKSAFIHERVGKENPKPSTLGRLTCVGARTFSTSPLWMSFETIRASWICPAWPARIYHSGGQSA